MNEIRCTVDNVKKEGYGIAACALSAHLRHNDGYEM